MEGVPRQRSRLRIANRVGRVGVVHSWGVLHHTGSMWSAIDNVADSVAVDGRLFISITTTREHPAFAGGGSSGRPTA
jgi:hypothetical protein